MQANRVALLDRSYGAAAGVLLVVGFVRVFYGAKGAAFYLQNPMFWAKILAFALIAALSILPTFKFIAWQRRARRPGFMPPAADVRSVRRLIVVQAGRVCHHPAVGRPDGTRLRSVNHIGRAAPVLPCLTRTGHDDHPHGVRSRVDCAAPLLGNRPRRVKQ